LLHLPDGSEIRWQIIDTLDTDDMKDDAGWNTGVITGVYIEKYYKKDDNVHSFDNSWKEFRNLSRKEGQNIEQYTFFISNSPA